MKYFLKRKIEVMENNIRSFIENMSKASTPTIRFFAMTLLVLLVTVEPAHANVLNNLGNALLDILNNTFLRAIATLAVIIVGIGALRGRIDGAIAITVIVGVVIIFGAAGIVQFLETNANVA